MTKSVIKGLEFVMSQGVIGMGNIL